MDSALACCAGGPGSIPADGKGNVGNIQMLFPSRYKVVKEMEPDTKIEWSSVSI